MAFPWQAAATLASGFFGGLLGNKAQSSANATNINIARETNAMNYRMMQEQNSFNKEMYNDYLSYNTPLAQRRRYLDAGINPYMALGNLQPGNAQSALQAAPSHPAVGTQVQPVNSLAQSIQSSMQNAALTYSAIADAKLKASQANKTDAETSWMDRLYENIVSLNNAKKDFTVKQGSLADFEYMFKNETLGNSLALSDLSVQQGQQLQEQLQKSNQLMDIQIKSARIDLDLKDKYQEEQIKASLADVWASYAERIERVMSSKYDRTVFKPRQLSLMQQEADTNAYNARTNRMNANTNAYNARTNRMNANTNSRLVDAQINKIASEIVESTARASNIKLDTDTKRKMQRYVVGSIKEDYNTKRNANSVDNMLYDDWMKSPYGFGSFYYQGRQLFRDIPFSSFIPK